MADFVKTTRPLPYLTQGGKTNSPAQILREKIAKIRIHEDKIVIINTFDSFALDKGVDPADDAKVKEVVGDFARRFKMDEKYALYLQYREKRAEIAAAAAAAREDYFSALKSLR